MEIITSNSSLIKAEREQLCFFMIRVASTLEELADLWPRTDHCGSVHCYAFQCADILQVWCDTVGKARGTRALFVAVFDGSGRPFLLLPLGIEVHRGIRILRFLDGGLCDYNAPILFEPVRTLKPDALKRLWQNLVDALPTFDIAMFEKMPAEICGVPNPLIGLGAAPVSPSGHFVTITKSWEEYAAQQLPYKREAGTQRRRLNKLGHCSFIVAETLADRQHILQEMQRQKSRRYMETWGSDGLERPGYRQYYTALVESLVWPGPVVISALAINGTIISTNWGLLSNKRFIGIVMTFEGGEWKRFSPGRILLEDLLKWTFANGIEIFDFGIGDESYKVAYTDQTLMLYQTNIPVTMLGKVYQAGRHTRAWKLLTGAITRAIKVFGS